MKLLALLASLAFSLSAIAQPYTVTQEQDRLIRSFGMSSELAVELTNWVGGGDGLLAVVLPNNVALKARNAAGTADLSLLKGGSDDDTYLMSDASDPIHLNPAGDAQRLFNFDASSDTALSFTFGDAGVTATQVMTISPSTTDADDDATLQVGFAAGTRGAGITLPSEEVAGGSDITYNAGTGDTHIFNIAGTLEATLGNDSLAFASLNIADINGTTGVGLGIAATREVTVTDDQLAFSGAAAEIVPGATSLSFKNNADNAVNLGIADAGAITIRSTFISSGTGDLGWSVVAGANTACSTTCTAACVFGVNTAATEADIVACADATADECLCAGAS